MSRRLPPHRFCLMKILHSHIGQYPQTSSCQCMLVQHQHGYNRRPEYVWGRKQIELPQYSVFTAAEKALVPQDTTFLCAGDHASVLM